MATDLRAAILAACNAIAAITVDLRALAGIDRELTQAEIVEVWRLSIELLFLAGRLNYDVRYGQTCGVLVDRHDKRG